MGMQGCVAMPCAARQQVCLRNADGHFGDVKCFASRSDASDGIHIVSVPNGIHMEFVHMEGMDQESYVLLRIIDTTVVEWAGTRGKGYGQATRGAGWWVRV